VSKKYILVVFLGVIGLLVSGCSILELGRSQTSDSSDSQDLEAALESSIESSTQEFSNSLIFTFDNFQCYGSYGCKVIYDFEYVGPPDRYSFQDYFIGKLSGILIGAPGSQDASLDVVVLQENDELAGFGYLDSSQSYSLIINTNSILKDEYEGIVLQLNGVTIFEDYFGCFRAKKNSVEINPTC
jgi:hypothetical protein